ncbi:inverse autotransporter beta domain-containing protein [Pantoea sp. B65]|uniref:inverse autotransporter beta domain-containing protein n=1 Tax=Pantoea sp. B65 TaxID=2813359 RepID=UPI0039B5E97F
MRKQTLAEIAKNPSRGWGKLLVVSQIALQVSLAISPFYLHSAHADAAQPPLKWYPSGNLTAEEQAGYQRQTARLATAGNLLSQDNTAAAAAGMARSAATGELNSALSGWLNQFGSARVQLNVDEKFGLNGSQADVLLPVYENDEVLLFSQLGFRHADRRNTGNLGLGARRFSDNWMFGVNTFYDNDFSGNNRRVGVGVEAWRDYLKLSGNSYWRLNDWHQSRDFADYDERPANGYDLRMEGWLPAYPQLGAKLMYEQYQGNEVALFGKDNRQKNPWAFSGGVNYTPIPLLTVGAEHRAGKSGQQDSQLSLAMNYRFGEPWQKQIDPAGVATSRLLSASRYDLVERNNNIVLDYRKQELLKLTLPEKISGKSRTVLPLSYTLKNKYAVQRINWESPALIAAGGSITPAAEGRINILLPDWQPAGANLYTLSGTVYDINGNTHSASTQIQVEMAAVSADSSVVEASERSIPANGTSTSVVTVKLLDANGQRVANMAPLLQMEMSETLQKNQPAAQRALKLKPAIISKITESSAGIYQATVTSGTRLGSIVVTPKVKDTLLTAVTIYEVGDQATATLADGDLTVDNTHVAANGMDKATFSAQVKDANGNPVEGVAIEWRTTLSQLIATDYSGADGKASATLSSSSLGNAQVTATVNGHSVNAPPVSFIADIKTAQVVTLTTDKAKITGTGVELAQLTATVADQQGHPVANATVNWRSSQGNLAATSQTNDSGVTVVTLTAPVLVASQNEIAVITSNIEGSDRQPVDSYPLEIRAVMQAAGKYYWTMSSDLHTDLESPAANFCYNHGRGRLLNRGDVSDFGSGSGHADFNRMNVAGEFKDGLYPLAGEWQSYGADLNSADGTIGTIQPHTPEGGSWLYACVKEA